MKRLGRGRAKNKESKTLLIVTSASQGHGKETRMRERGCNTQGKRVTMVLIFIIFMSITEDLNWKS